MMKHGIGAAARSFARDLALAWIYLPISLLACTIMALLARSLFGLQYSTGAVVATALLLGTGIGLLGPALRNRWCGGALITGLASLLLVGNAVKVGMLHAPLSVADLQALPILLSTLSGGPLLLAGVLIAIAVLLPLASIRFRWRSLPALALLIGMIAVIPALSNPSHPFYGFLLPLEGSGQEVDSKDTMLVSRRNDQMSLLKARGPLLYLSEDWRVQREDTREIPSAAEIHALPLKKWHPGNIAKKRNVHLVLLESVWDLSLLDHYHSNRSALDPRFLALWKSAGQPYLLSPEMGGVTANAEFEVLCGFPAPRNSVAFMNLLRRPSPCLPAALARAGYHTMASHAHNADNWNRITAYENAGFEHYYPDSAFELDDLEGGMLADGSFFRQNIQFLDEVGTDVPVFNYLVSLSSHWGYLRNQERRPDLIRIEPGNAPVLEAYANAVAYTTAAFMDWSEAIIARDPDALIIAFGDHSPSLDADPDPYTFVNGADPADFDSPDTRRRVGMSRTPLLILDGRRGAVATGTNIPMYELPGLIGQLLGNNALLPQSAQQGPMILRPFRGHLLSNDDGRWFDCGNRESPVRNQSCDHAWGQFSPLRLLRQDTLLGEGHYLSAQHALAFRNPRLKAISVEQRHAACEFDLDDWSPRIATSGLGFNVQSDGSSAMWFSMKHLRGMPVVHVGEVAGISNQGDHLLTASFPAGAIAGLAGRQPVTLTCPGQRPVQVGTLAFETRTHASQPENCSFTVDQWGPHTGTGGRGFNLDPDGRSTVWVTMKQLKGQPLIHVNGMTGNSTFGENLVTAAFTDMASLTEPTSLPVTIACPGQPAVELGAIQLGAAAH